MGSGGGTILLPNPAAFRYGYDRRAATIQNCRVATLRVESAVRCPITICAQIMTGACLSPNALIRRDLVLKRGQNRAIAFAAQGERHRLEPVALSIANVRRIKNSPSMSRASI